MIPPVGSSNVFVPLIVLALLAWSIYRRTRSQQVRLTRTVVITVLIVASSLFGLASNTRLLGNPLFIELAPVALLAGLAVGWLMMRTIRFWRDRSSGQVWMSGGAAYVAIWLATLALRIGIDYLATGGNLSTLGRVRGDQPPTMLSIVASDLLFLSVGLWLARGYALVRRYREYAKAEAGD